MHGICVDAARKHVQCVQPIIVHPPPPPPGPGVTYPRTKPGPTRITLALPTQIEQPKTELIYKDPQTLITVTVHVDRRQVSAADAKVYGGR